MIKVTVNGERKQIPEGVNLLALLNALNVPTNALVVEYNGTIIGNEQFSETLLKDGDALELVRFVGGG